MFIRPLTTLIPAMVLFNAVSSTVVVSAEYEYARANQQSRYVKNITNLDICLGALTEDLSRWDDRSPVYVAEAKMRNFDVNRCKVKLVAAHIGNQTMAIDRKEPPSANQPQLGDADESITPNRDLSYANLYPEIAVNELPYGAGVDFFVERENITTITKQMPSITTISKRVQPESNNETFKPTKGGALINSLIERGVSAEREKVDIDTVNPVFPAANKKVTSRAAKVEAEELSATPLNSAGDNFCHGNCTVAGTQPSTIDENVKSRKFALVIGNASYRQISWLENPDDDATAIARSLENNGFTVKLVLNATQSEMQLQLLEFSKQLENGINVGLLYYSGHAIQIGARNFLLPIDIDRHVGDSIYNQATEVAEFIRVMEINGVTNKIVILDACRNNPLDLETERGLAQMKAGKGAFIAYSTEPGSIASDGEDKSTNSPYSAALVDALAGAPASIEEIFKQVRARVVDATNGKQIPWESSSLVENISLNSEISKTNYDTAVAEELQNGVTTAESSPRTQAVSQAQNNIPLDTAYTEDDEELAGMSADVSAVPATPRNKPVSGDTADGSNMIADSEGINQSYPFPKPRPKPIEVLMMAAVAKKVEPVSVLPSDANTRQTPDPLDGNSIGVVIAAETMTYIDEPGAIAGGKTSLPEEIRIGQSAARPRIQSITTPKSNEGNNGIADLDGVSQGYSIPKPRPKPIEVLMRAAVTMEIDPPNISAEHKGVRQVVNSDGKGSILDAPNN